MQQLTISDIHHFDESNKVKVYASLGKVLVSRIFSASPRQQRFLRYLVDQTLNNHSKQIRGYNIAIDVFDRGLDFDTSLDSIVRVEAGRLRAKLREYYEAEGVDDSIHFELPKGTYAIVIHYKKRHDEIILMRHDDFPRKTNINRIPIIDEVKQLSTANKPSLAILPFANISADQSEAYLADGITDSLFFALSNFYGLLLSSRQSSFAFRGKSLGAEQIGLALGVRYLLEGSVQRVDHRIRISVRLLDSLTDRCIWAERYDYKFEDLFDLQDEITRNVVNMLHIKLFPSAADVLDHIGTVSSLAYDQLKLGLEEYWKYTPDSVEKAINFIRLALQHDSNYAAANVWMARAMTCKWMMCWSSGDDILDIAYQHARTAVQLNKYLPCAFSVLGWVQVWRKNEQESIAACRQGVMLDSSSADGLMFYSLSLSASGHGESALHYMEMSMQLAEHPTSFYLFALGQAHYVLGNYNLAESAWQRGCEICDGFMPNYYFLCLLYALLERNDECRKKREEIFSRNNGSRIQIRSPWIDRRLALLHQELLVKAELG